MSLALIGWTVVQSLWQWSLIGGATVLILGLLQDRSARRRHAICCVSLLLMIATSVVTLIAAGVRVEPVFRGPVLYAFGGVAIVPAICRIGPHHPARGGGVVAGRADRSTGERRSGPGRTRAISLARTAILSRSDLQATRQRACTSRCRSEGRSPCGRHRARPCPWSSAGGGR